MKGKLLQLHTAFAEFELKTYVAEKLNWLKPMWPPIVAETVEESFYSLSPSFGQLSMSLLNTWPSYSSSILACNATTPLSAPMGTVEESLLSSLPSLGAVLGTAFIGLLINKFGRKNGGIISAIPFVLSWTMAGMASSMPVLLVARFLGGMAGGASLVYGPVFISEIAEKSFRGTLASGPVLLMVLGTLFSYIIGWLMTYKTIIWTNLSCNVVYILLLVFVKESPVFLLKNNREEEARKSIAYYRGCSPSSRIVVEEISLLKQQLRPAVPLLAVDEDVENKIVAEKEKLKSDQPESEKEQKKMSPIKMLFVSPSSRRAFFLVFTVLSLQVMMGMQPMQVFAKRVFMETNPDQADLYAVIFALVLTCGSLVTTLVADKLGRRLLIISSSVCVCVCMSALGALVQSRAAPPWLTVLLILTFCFTFMFGAGSVPYVLLAEVFVSEVQNVASILLIEWLWLLIFALLAVFPIMNKLVGIYGSFYCFAAFAMANAIISYFIVPETKGLSNEQIQELFLTRNKKNKK